MKEKKTDKVHLHLVEKKMTKNALKAFLWLAWFEFSSGHMLR